MNRGKITAPELAERFGVSVRTIYRDIDALDLAGVPITTTQGSGGGIALMPGYRIDGGFFTPEELTDLTATLEGITPLLSATHLPTAVGKMGALGGVGRVASPETDASPVSPVSFDFSTWQNHAGLKRTMGVLIASVKAETAVRFAYTSLKAEKSLRIVEPLTVVFRGSNWYLSGWCRLRKDYRWFTVARIEELETTDSRFDRRRRLAETPATDGFSEPPVSLRLALTRRGAIRAQPYVDASELQPDGNGRWLAVIRWPPNEWIYSFLMGLGDDAEVLGPPEIREEMRRRLRNALSTYDS